MWDWVIVVSERYGTWFLWRVSIKEIMLIMVIVNLSLIKHTLHKSDLF